MVERLVNMLTEVRARAGDDFSGIGIIVCDTPKRLPVVPIRLANGGWHDSSTVDTLLDISSIHSEFHDGFHVVSSAGQLTLVAQYFSPPIAADVKIDRSKRFGGRYLAALFGSALPMVRATGIVSNGFGIAIFQNGTETYFKPAL